MPKTEVEHLTDRQRKWFAAVRDGLERETGKSLTEWVEIAKACPESKHRARLNWFKQNHGLLQNRASYVLSEAFPAAAGWSEPDALREALWADPASKAIFEAVEAAVTRLPEVIVGQRKGYSAWSRRYQFAALRPIRGGKARLGLAVSPSADASLEPAKTAEGWSERLKAALVLDGPGDVTPAIGVLLKQAWEAS